MSSIAERGETPPIYRMILKALQAEIDSGHYPVGTPLPSEAELVARFGVSRNTIRESLRMLRDRGLVESGRGRRTLVCHSGGHSPYVHRVNSISDLFDSHVVSQYRPIADALVQLPERYARAFGLAEDSRWLHIAGLRHAAGEAIALCAADIFIAARFAGVGRVIGQQAGPIYGLIETVYDQRIGEVQQDVSAFKADQDAYAAIGMADGDVGIEIRRKYCLDAGGEAAMLSFNRYPADRYTFSMALRRQGR